jgi:excisionase family DNA binding protein
LTTLNGARKLSSMLSRPFLTTHEIAELLKVREPTVRAWIHDGELRAVRLGREFRVAAKDLEAFLNAHATREPAWGPPPAPESG